MLFIRKMVGSDAKHIVDFNTGTDEDFLRQWAGRCYTYPLTTQQIIDRLNHTENMRCLCITMENEIIGTCELDFIDWEALECSVCRYLIGNSYRCLGYGTNSLKLIVNYAFDELKMRKIKLSVFDFNTPAIRCYEKVGFIVTGSVTRPNGWIALQMEIANPAV